MRLQEAKKNVLFPVDQEAKYGDSRNMVRSFGRRGCDGERTIALHNRKGLFLLRICVPHFSFRKRKDHKKISIGLSLISLVLISCLP